MSEHIKKAVGREHMKSVKRSLLAKEGRGARSLGFVAGFVGASAVGLVSASAQNQPAAEPARPAAAPAPATAAAEKPTGIVPLEDYSGDIRNREWILGDFNGARTDLAAKGFQFGVDWVQT